MGFVRVLYSIKRGHVEKVGLRKLTNPWNIDNIEQCARESIQLYQRHGTCTRSLYVEEEKKEERKKERKKLLEHL